MGLKELSTPCVLSESALRPSLRAKVNGAIPVRDVPSADLARVESKGLLASKRKP